MNDGSDTKRPSKPLVSVGIPCYNRPDGLRCLLDSIIKQSYSNLDIIISDNCSTDDGVGQVAQEFASRDPRIRYFRQDTNIGLYPNHDFVRNHALGDYFFWVADDDEIPVDYVEKCMAHFDDAPDIVMVGPSCDRYLDGDYWYTYDNYSDVGKDTYHRLKDMIPHAFTGPNKFEQYFYGIFLKKAIPKKFVLGEFRCELRLFFQLSERGCIQHASDVRLVKSTSKAHLDRYKKRAFIHRHLWLNLFGRTAERTIPVTVGMILIVIRSGNLKFLQKMRLISKCLTCYKSYVLYPDFKYRVNYCRRQIGRSYRLSIRVIKRVTHFG
jgi:glycosyltransferase involved in cell wall biosynthesis